MKNNIKPGYKLTEIGVIPEDWEVKNIISSCKMKARIGWQGLTMDEYLSNGEYLLITGTDFSNGSINWEKCCFVSQSRYQQDKNIQIKPCDILITKDGTIGKVAFVKNMPFKATLNSGVFVIRPKTNSYISSYLFYIFTSDYFANFLTKLVAGSTIIHLYQKDFVSFIFPLPKSNNEQTAIANTLGSVDELISSLEKLIAKKKAIKQGAMQELLKPKDGWAVKKLGEIAEIRKGQMITANTSLRGDIPVIAGGKTPAYYTNTANRFKQTVTISASGANAGYVGFHNSPIFASDCSTIEEDSKYSINYIYFCLVKNQEYIYKLQTGGAQPHIHPCDIALLEIPLPKTTIQNKISTILMHMDSEIGSLEKKLEKYKKIKLGMMQELLAGKVRLV